AARMYPETDIPPIKLREEYIKELEKRLPELPEQKLKRLMREYSLNEKIAKQLMDSEYTEFFEAVAKETKISPTTIAVFLTETMKALKRDGIPTEKITEDQIREIFKSLSLGEITKETLQDIAAWLAKHEGQNVKEAIKSLGLKTMSREELEKIIDNVIAQNKDLIKKSGEKAFGPIMGVIMREVRGKADAGLVSEVLRKKLKS
ncbi:MAG: GatB/YqeY domain-containing protein, partial [Candidatus Bathyarchaeia archaeon]